MAFLAAKWTVLPVKEHALADVRLHVAFGGLCELAGAVTEGTVRIGNFYGTLTRTDRAFLDISLSHPVYVDSTII